MSAMRILLAALLASVLAGCGYNEIQSRDEAVKGAWAEVISQYQRRADLIPNIVNTVKGEANFEQETLTRVIEARAKATSIQATPELVNNAEAMAKFQQAQGELSSALSRLMVPAGAGRAVLGAVAADGHGRAVPRPEGQPGLPGPAHAARRHREPHHGGAQPLHPGHAAVQRAGAAVPGQPVFGYKEKAQFTVENEAAVQKAPTVDFGAPKK